MRKGSVFFALCVFFCSGALSAKGVKFFTPEMHWAVENGVALESKGKGAPVFARTDINFALDMKELYVSSGVQMRMNAYDITAEAVYWPSFFSWLNIGAGMIFHTQIDPECFVEYDFLYGLFAKVSPLDWLSFSVNMLRLRKTARIWTADSDSLRIKNGNLAFSVGAVIKPVERLAISLDFSSYSYYRVMLFLAPDFKLGVSYKTAPSVTVGSEVDVQYIDMFTLSANLNSVNFRAYVKMEF